MFFVQAAWYVGAMPGVVLLLSFSPGGIKTLRTFTWRMLLEIRTTAGSACMRARPRRLRRKACEEFKNEAAYLVFLPKSTDGGRRVYWTSGHEFARKRGTWPLSASSAECKF